MNLASPTPPQASAAVRPVSGGRLVYLDSVRGLMLLIMAINHIPNPIKSYTDHTFGFVSAAEGFVFLAGLLAGLIYTKKEIRSGTNVMQDAALKRAATIYRYHVFTYLIVLAWVVGLSRWHGYPLADMPPQMTEHPWRCLLTGPLLIYQPTLFDILPMYCGLILLIPVLIRGYERRHRTLVLTLSLGLWAVVNLFCSQKPLTTEWVQTGSFNVCAWQVLFVFGTALGHAWARGEQLIPPAKAWFVSLAIVFAAVCFCIRHALLANPLSAETLSWLTNKNNLSPLRLVDVAAVFYLSYLLLTRFPKFFSIRPLAFLGRSSIVVFSTHVFVAYGLHASPRLFADTIGGQWLGIAIIVASLFVAAAWDHIFNKASPKSNAVDARKTWSGTAKPFHDK